MDVRYLDDGTKAPADSNRVTIEALPNGMTGFTGSARISGISVTSVDEKHFAKAEEALRAALQWAHGIKLATVYVERPGS